ncbi:PorP/SprF family type IX secretion system membrane protein [Fulvivirga lutea]|uniref:PorP/SprF family type IX secretion system membrane protein n=1 Tax=Fulvivirga lutea TaxID=2810512 RepID=A0A974WGQ0_9BACT|nr:PorP/SprF family type IX secretion system membrane protein [Fulvivirga lutea]QSE96782.1 PorP/SprF family type IX secretion system membrane protein [Fulvivirga lutea]
MFFRLLILCCSIFWVFSIQTSLAQDNSNFSHYFMNPYTINPSYAGTDGRPSLFLTYRMQWLDIEGAPKIANASFHTPIGNKIGFGLNITNAERGPLNTTSAYLSNSVGISLSDKFVLRFGASFGAASNTVDTDVLANVDPNILIDIDPLAEDNLFLIGNAGLSLQAKYFNFGVSIPNIFSDELVTTESFSQGEISPLENLLIFASNRFYFSKKKKHMFEPYLLYRYSDVLPPLIEGTGIITLNHTVWFGGSYRQDFGISALAGFKFNKTFGLGYSYSIQNSDDNEINSPTHEIQLNLLLGGKKKDRFVYSFVDSELPKPKSKRQLALEERRKQLEEQRKLEEQRRQLEAEEKAKEEERLAQERAENEAKSAEEREARELAEREAREKAVKEAQEKANQIAKENAAKNNEKAVTEPIVEDEIQKQPEKPMTETVVEEKVQREEDKPIQEPIIENKPTPKVKENKPVNPAQNLVERYTTEDRVVVKRGGHLLELQSGEYVIVGVFGSYEHAEKYSDDLFFRGYQSKFGYITQEGYWYVYVHQGDVIEDARAKRDELRRKQIFSKAWVLTVQ